LKVINHEYRTLILIIVPEAEGGADPISPWFLFNDFVVDNIPEDEALSFPDRWKVSGSLSDRT